MTQEEKQLLLKDLCARLPYGVRVYDALNDRTYVIEWLNPLNAITSGAGFTTPIEECKPYLRPMSSMTEEEAFLWDHESADIVQQIDWLNAHHFDYRDLIERGLALEATERMYK